MTRRLDQGGESALVWAVVWAWVALYDGRLSLPVACS
jgi:hypothetical protein